jgi:dihydroorotase
MTERYISKHPKPTPYERELLTILMEECGESIQAAAKLLRFGARDGYPGGLTTNAADLSREIGEIQCMVEMAVEAGLIDPLAINVAREHKRGKVLRFMQETP